MSTTFEEAKKCPKCGLPGDDASQQPVQAARGKRAVAHVIYCRNRLCKWFDTSWIVQVNEDGSIPEEYAGMGPKKYPALSQESQSRVEDAIRAQLDAETRPGGSEVRNPFG